MTPHEFVAKWKRADLSEKSACHQHFLDLCDLLGQPKPAAADPDGAWYTFERGVRKVDGGSGWADVWMRGHFGWEYKGKLKNLEAAYKQLLQYREALENPPLLVVCDLDRFEIHTNFTGTLKVVHAFDLDELAQPKNLDILRKVFTDPAALKPGVTAQGVTEQAAELIGQLADGMRIRSIPAPRAAHFLMKLMFCMFAEDIGLLPGNVFSKIMEAATKPGPSGLPESNAGQRFAQLLRGLFEAMAATIDARGIGTVRYPRLVPKDDECAKHLKKRTLTNLYNQRPTWLDLAHRRLDESVFAAYGWPPDLTDDQLLERLLDLNLARAAEQSTAPAAEA